MIRVYGHRLKNYYTSSQNSTVGILIEPNILERHKEVVGKKPDFETPYFENLDHFGDGLQLTSRLSSSYVVPFRFQGEFQHMERAPQTTNNDGVVNIHNLESGSLGMLGLPTLVRINQHDPRSEFSNLCFTLQVLPLVVLLQILQI